MYCDITKILERRNFHGLGNEDGQAPAPSCSAHFAYYCRILSSRYGHIVRLRGYTSPTLGMSVSVIGSERF
jgi:hypothetical protein